MTACPPRRAPHTLGREPSGGAHGQDRAASSRTSARPRPPEPAAPPRAAGRAARGAIAVWLMLALRADRGDDRGGRHDPADRRRARDHRVAPGDRRAAADDAADWEAEFAKYRDSPQFRLPNPGMTLAEFQRIYWWEWGHRAARPADRRWSGRVGFLWFLAAAAHPAGLDRRGCSALGVLGRAAGRDRLVDGRLGPGGRHGQRRLDPAGGASRPRLPDPRADRLVRADAAPRGGGPPAGAAAAQRRADRLGHVLVAVGLRAGPARRAGRGDRRRPQLCGLAADGGRGLPSDGARAAAALARTSSRIPGLVQFNHRLLGYCCLRPRPSSPGCAAGAARSTTSAAPSTRCCWRLLAQVALGIVTVLYAAPWQVAIVHQSGAVALFALPIRARLRRSTPGRSGSPAAEARLRRGSEGGVATLGSRCTTRTRRSGPRMADGGVGLEHDIVGRFATGRRSAPGAPGRGRCRLPRPR